MSRIIHFEIHASQPQALMDFYTAVAGWKFSKWGPVDYWLIETGPADQAGINGAMLPREGAAPQAGQAVNAFVCTAQVTSLDQALSRSAAMGGSLALPKRPVQGIGWIAYVSDPDGNLVGLMEPDEHAA